jgi:protein SCO1/2
MLQNIKPLTLWAYNGTMTKKTLFYIVFFIALVVGFYFVLTRVIPGFGEKRISPVSYVRPFSFINQDGQTVTEKDVAGKVYVAEYFFTTCKGICPRMNGNMKKVYEKFRDEPDFLILAHTSDPETDSAAILKEFSRSLGVNTSKWIFLTGRKDSLYNMARVSYTIDDPANNLKSIEDDFLHTQFWALVDRNGDVKKIYDGLKETEVQALIRDIEKLLKG